MSTLSNAKVVGEINQWHAEACRCVSASQRQLHEALVAAWRAGQLLVSEKKSVQRRMGRGAWLSWLAQNFRGTPRTAQRYMKLARSVPEIGILAGMSVRQAYARLGIATEPKNTGRTHLRHSLPPHILLTNQLLRALRTGRNANAAAEENYRRDLRVLYEELRTWFEPAPISTAFTAGVESGR